MKSKISKNQGVVAFIGDFLTLVRRNSIEHNVKLFQDAIIP